MYSPSWLQLPASTTPPSADELQTLLAHAQALQRGPAQVLQGKRLALMCADADGQAAQLFLQAARELGVHVSLLPASTADCRPEQLPEIGAMLGRLYDAVEWQGVSADVVRQLATAGNIPMFTDLAGHEHRLFSLAKDWEAGLPLAERHRRMIQAALVLTLI
jgi:ornithine carbamoyltransferase